MVQIGVKTPVLFAVNTETTLAYWFQRCSGKDAVGGVLPQH
jgi:hypothetical protein